MPTPTTETNRPERGCRVCERRIAMEEYPAGFEVGTGPVFTRIMRCEECGTYWGVAPTEAHPISAEVADDLMRQGMAEREVTAGE
jgi:hypothetical protein